MQKGQSGRDRAQLAFDLDGPPPDRPPPPKLTGLVEALADLLLEALAVETATITGGADERQDHA